MPHYKKLSTQVVETRLVNLINLEVTITEMILVTVPSFLTLLNNFLKDK